MFGLLAGLLSVAGLCFAIAGRYGYAALFLVGAVLNGLAQVMIEG